MKLLSKLIFLVIFSSISQVSAQSFETIGRGRLFTNDYLTDGQDRWRSGSYVFSLVKSRSPWSEQLPTKIGDTIELRFRNEIIAPANLVRPAAGDRPYAGVLSFGLHSHSSLAGGAELSAGADLVVAGASTGVSRFQDYFHNTFLGEDPSYVYDTQIEGVFPTATVEIARPFDLSDSTSVRPFVEGTVGVETLVRLGADFVIGNVGQNDLFLRDVTTGQLYRGAQLPTGGLSFVFGGDLAYVSDSKYLPTADGFVLTDSRARARAGIHWLSGEKSAFYGVTWLGPEFAGQPEGQFTGSLTLLLQF